MERTIKITGSGKDVIDAAKEIIKYAIDNPILANSMQTLQYTMIDKSTWGKGEWQYEPDKKQWSDEETGYPCLIVRNQYGALCGYVGVSEGHPLFGKHYDRAEVEVHGGLTFSDRCTPSADESHGICHIDPSNDNVWWLGFDCAHAWDIVPALAVRYGLVSPDDIYRNIAYVTSEVQSLARQLKALEV